MEVATVKIAPTVTGLQIEFASPQTNSFVGKRITNTLAGCLTCVSIWFWTWEYNMIIIVSTGVRAPPPSNVAKPLGDLGAFAPLSCVRGKAVSCRGEGDADVGTPGAEERAGSRMAIFVARGPGHCSEEDEDGRRHGTGGARVAEAAGAAAERAGRALHRACGVYNIIFVLRLCH